MNAKAMKFRKGHTDKYVYIVSRSEWVKVSCGLGEADLHCTAPRVYPRGTEFDYNTTLTEAEEYALEVTE